MPLEQYDFEAVIDEIGAHEGRGTELVTITIPPNRAISDVREQVTSELAQARNIKSDRTRENVERALEHIRQLLAGETETPENGLVVYAGVVDDELVSYVLDDLPGDVSEAIYHCDCAFETSVLEDLVRPDETVGLIVVERGAGIVGELVGSTVEVVREIDSQVMGKSRAGGQSAQRFARERERQLHEHFSDIGDVANGAFAEADSVEGVLVGGTLSTARQFVDVDYLDHRLSVLGTYPVEYATETGLEALVEKADAEVLDPEVREVREAVAEFESRLAGDDPVTYGRDAVERAIQFGAVDTLLCLPDTDGREDLATAVDQQGGEVVVVPGRTDAGERFAETFELGALLRFPVD